MTNKSVVPNRLIHEKSPYLLQHAHNPVDWYPWGNEAFEKAKREDKPIFLSIGYSTCHWCHVMERESFEDEEVAEILNKYFISIKVDKEERPDVDSIYMNVCQALTGNGGWPLTIIMTEDKKPFFAGTYFPKESKYGRPGIMDLLMSIHEAWTERKDKLIQTSNDILTDMKKYNAHENKEELNKESIYDTYEELMGSFDEVYGGFGNAPKFPIPHQMYFLLRYSKAYGDKKALQAVEKTLESMYKGGIFDHIGFGFSRYSTDRKWLVPHFEKMLYDNALLAIAYVEVYQATGKNLYREAAEKIFNYILRDMASPEGGFYSAEDADSEGVEGKFYVWSVEEIKKILGEEDGSIFCEYYDISTRGNFEGESIPNLINKDLREIERNHDLLETLREKLFNHREKRIHPHKDDKILTSWNGLMIAALALGGRVLDNESYVKAAENAVNFIYHKLINKEGRLLARFREGEAAYLGYLDDYAFLVWGVIELYGSTLKSEYLEKALKLNEDMIRIFWDEKENGLFLYGKDSEELILRPKEVYDGAVPSGNSVAAFNMLKLSKLIGSEELEDKAVKIFEAFGGTVKRSPSAYSYLICALLYHIEPTKTVTIVGEREDSITKEMISEYNNRYMAFSSLVFNDGGAIQGLVSGLKEYEKINKKTTAYVCENFACKEPVNETKKFIRLLE